MGIYTYECLTCGKIEDRLVKYEESEKMQQCDCRPELSMVKKQSYGTYGLNFKGKWYKTTKSY